MKLKTDAEFFTIKEVLDKGFTRYSGGFYINEKTKQYAWRCGVCKCLQIFDGYDKKTATINFECGICHGKGKGGNPLWKQ